ncbi:MAG TPA: hypothetical protein VGL48_13855 [Acidimicrobiales bacterium]
MPIEAAEMLRRVFRSAGIDAVYGAACPPLPVTAVPATVAETFAVAHQRVHGTRAAVSVGDGVFTVPGASPSPPRVIELHDGADLPAALAGLASDAAVELRLSFSLSQPVEDLVPEPAGGDDTWLEPGDDAAAAWRGATKVSVLAGPGVGRAAAIPGLHDLAAVANLGVLNTWGAKGVFHWRSRHHLATVGLQADDFTLSGLGEVDLIVATGLDPDEAPEDRWRLAPALVVPPGALAALAERCQPVSTEIVVPPLRTRLAGVTQRGWAVERGPLPPTRVTLHYAECLASGGLIAADAGLVGYWVARTLGTTRLGGVLVPSAPRPGWAAACVAVALLRQPDRPALALIDASDDRHTALVVDAARSLGVPVPVEVWDAAGPPLDAEAHRERLRRLMGGGSAAPPEPQSLATDGSQLLEMIDAAGSIVAWT